MMFAMSETDSVTLKMRALRERAGLSMAELAKAMGYKNASSVQRYEDPAIFTKPHFTAEYVGKLLKVLAGKGSPPISPAEIWELSGLSSPRPYDENVGHGFSEDYPIFPSVPLSKSTVKVVGKVAANTWLDVSEMDFFEEDVESVPADSNYPSEFQFALKVQGECLNKIAPHGATLVCLSLIKAVETFKDGQLVIVERRRYGGQMVERTAKRVRMTSHGYELWPESNDKRYQTPIVFDETSPGTDEVAVIGRVLLIMVRP